MTEESWVVSTASRALALGTPLLWGALGEIYAERAGVLNLGVEGMISLGALSAFAVAYTTGQPWLGLLAATAVGSLAALCHAFVCITLRANQYVSGLALTMTGLGLSGLLGRGWEGRPLHAPLADITVPGLSALPWLGPALFVGHSALTYMGLLLAIILWLGLYHSRWGMILRAVGEAPAAADAQGVRVVLSRYVAVIFGGALAGVAGGFLSVAYRPAWTEGMSAGMGWIVLALVIFAAWDPLKAVAGAWCFGALYHLAFRWQSSAPPELLKMLPYAGTLVILSLIALGKQRYRHGAPEALGRPYRRGER
jgi:general nucleoside transport system permease protein